MRRRRRRGQAFASLLPFFSLFHYRRLCTKQTNWKNDEFSRRSRARTRCRIALFRPPFFFSLLPRARSEIPFDRGYLSSSDKSLPLTRKHRMNIRARRPIYFQNFIVSPSKSRGYTSGLPNIMENVSSNRVPSLTSYDFDIDH